MNEVAQNLGLLPSFVRAAELLSFSAVARELRVTPVAVSKSIATLERNLGVRLFHRSTRAVSLTEEGRALYEACAEPMRTLLSSTKPQHSRTKSGTVRVSCVPPFGKEILIPMLRKFSVVHPGVRVELILEGRIADMVKEDVDLGVRAGRQPGGDRVVRRLCELTFVICGAPDYFARRGVPRRVSDLAQHDCLRFGALDRKADFDWQLGPSEAPMLQAVRGRFASTDMIAVEQAALHGLGLWLAPLPVALPYFRAEKLRPVLLPLMRRGLALFLHYRSRRNLPERTRTLRDFLLDQVRVHPDLHVDPQEACRPFAMTA